MSKFFWIILSMCILMVISIIDIASGLVPSFIAPFIIALFGLYIVYMARS